MTVTLKWNGLRLMLGTLMVGEVREASMFDGPSASYTIPGNMPIAVNGRGRFDATNEAARAQCVGAAIAALSAAGVIVEATP